MADTKLYRISAGKARELPGESVALEKSLQHLIEANMEELLGIRFLASEHDTGKAHGGRIDSLGLDEDNCPVVIEYKRTSNENVINQGLFYLDWLMDHQADFELLVLKKLGKEASEAIDWEQTRLICIAGDYIKYDLHAVRQINRNIELMRYKRFGDDLLMLELINAVTADQPGVSRQKNADSIRGQDRPEDKPETHLLDLYEELKSFIMALGDDVTFKQLKHYKGFRRIKNFACVWTGTKEIAIWLKLNPSEVKLENGFSRDMTNIGHLGTGDLEVAFRDREGLEKAKPLILKAYQQG
jgi:predicted transport protein